MNEGVYLSPVYLMGILAGAGTIIVFLYRAFVAKNDQLLAARDREFALQLLEKNKAIDDAAAANKAYREFADEALKAATDIQNDRRKSEGKPVIIPVPPVVPEGKSPSTETQIDAAHLATLRARMADIKRESGLDPRPFPGQEDEPSNKMVPEGLLAVVKNRIDQVPEKTAELVVEELDEREKKDKA